MATHEISILGFSTVPDASGNVFVESYPIKATNDFWKHLVFVFNDTATDDYIYGTFTVPQNYVSTGKWVIRWTATATSGNVVWEQGYRTVGGDDTTSLDQATAEETQTVIDAAPTAANNRLEVTITPTSGNFAAGETVEFKFGRKGTSASETMAAAAILFNLSFRYSDA